MNAPYPIPFKPDWPAPDARLMRAEALPAPPLPLSDVLHPRLEQWVRDAAEAKGAPPDYVFAALLIVAASTIGNTRWVSPWSGWEEPPVLWTMCIGLPSAGKSPAIDAVLQPLRQVERRLRKAAEAEADALAERIEVAELAAKDWRAEVKAAVKAGEQSPPKPEAASIDAPPHIPRLIINDATIEKIGVILARQPRGILQVRDELAGWLEGMKRYSPSSDCPFWIEAFGGRSYAVERINREPVSIDMLTVGVLGGIQPAPFIRLLRTVDDDGLFARFLPIWPAPVPLRRPQLAPDMASMERILSQLVLLDFSTNEDGQSCPKVMSFAEGARELMDDFRQRVRDREAEADGLILSFLGKLPGMVARLSLVLTYLDWAVEGTTEPREIQTDDFRRAVHLVETYLLPMAGRAYAEASTSKTDRAARRLIGIIREKGWRSFTSRDVQRLDRAGLGKASDLDPALAALEEGDCIRPVEKSAKPQGGRPSRLFAVNPEVHALAG